jgi:hypothetical protein
MDKIYRQEVSIEVNDVYFKGELVMPGSANAIIIFGDIPGNNGLNNKNKMIAAYLLDLGFGTFTVELLTSDEGKLPENRADVSLLTFRLVRITEWLEDRMQEAYRWGYFAIGTVAAAALFASTAMQQVAAVVSLGGNLELAGDALPEMQAATLLLVGSLDQKILIANQNAFNHLHKIKKLEIMMGSDCLSDDKSVTENICKLTGAWFRDHLEPRLASKATTNLQAE